METFLGLVLVFGFIAFLFWLLSKGIKKGADKKYKENSDNHFIRTYMNTCSDEKMRTEVVEALDRAVNKLPIPVFLTENYLFFKKMGGVEFIPLSNIVWIYSKTTNLTTKMGSTITYTNSLEVRLDGNVKKSVAIGTENASYIIGHILALAPWISTGYSETLERDMKNNFTYYQKEKDKKYKEYISNKNEQ